MQPCMQVCVIKWESCFPSGRVNPTAMSLKAACELFLRYTTRTSALELYEFDRAKAHLIERGNHFAEISTRARVAIAEHGARSVGLFKRWVI